jgi:hypothetical protein
MASSCAHKQPQAHIRVGQTFSSLGVDLSQVCLPLLDNLHAAAGREMAAGSTQWQLGVTRRHASPDGS